MAAPPTALSREEIHATHSAVPHPFHPYGGAYSLGVSTESCLIPQLSMYGWEGSFFSSTQFSDMVNSESVMGIKPSISGVVIEYQVNKFTHSWLVEHLIA